MKLSIIEFIQQELVDELDAICVDEQSELLLDGIVDSMGIMRLVGFLEAEAEISIPAEHITIENFRTVSQIATYIAERREASE